MPVIDALLVLGRWGRSICDPHFVRIPDVRSQMLSPYIHFLRTGLVSTGDVLAMRCQSPSDFAGLFVSTITEIGSWSALCWGFRLSKC